MPENAARRLARYVREKCGDDLRTVVLVTDGGWEGVYLRDDLREEYSPSVYSQTVELFRPREEPDGSIDFDLPLGMRHATVFYHDEAFVFRFRYSMDDYILVSIAPEAGEELLDFIADCQTIVQAS